MERLSKENNFYMTYGHKKIWKTFALRFAQIARGLLLLLFLSSCQEEKEPEAEDISLSELNLELVESLSGKKIKLSEINKGGNYALRLSDIIFFENLKKVEDFQGSVSEKEIMEVSSTCLINKEAINKEAMNRETMNRETINRETINKKRYTLNKKFSHYQSRFYILDLLPEELLLEHKKNNPVSCSFLFIIRDKKGNEHLYNMPLLPLLSVGESSSLKILNDKNQEVTGQLLRKDNMNRFDLILEQGRKAEKIKFLCEEIPEKEIIFMLNQAHSLISPFQRLQSLKAEKIPYGKTKCRILTYEKINVRKAETGHSSQVYMANGISGSFSVDFETLHKKFEFPGPDLLQEEPVIKNQAGKEITLSEINAGKKYTWSLSDEILFEGLNAFFKAKSEISQEESVSPDIFAPETDSKKSPVAEALATCLMKHREDSSKRKDALQPDRWALKKEFADYPSRFSFLNLLPEELFLNYKKGSLVSCSLSFVLRDKEGKLYTHNIPSLPVLSVEKGVFLKFLNAQNKEAGIQDTVDAESGNHFSIVLQKEGKAERIKFLCEGLEEQMSFDLDSGGSLFTPFPILRSLQNKEIPSGKRKCRILTYAKNQAVNGMTGFFQIHFETFKNQKSAWMPKENALQVRIKTFPPKKISQTNQYQRGAKYREDLIYIISSFEIPKLFEILPKNFTRKDFHSYKIKVDTECFRSILQKYKGLQKENLAAETYYLPLLDSFSVMSVTPEEALQIYFPDNLLDLLTEISPEDLPLSKQVWLDKEERYKIQLNDYRQWFICSYHFQIQNREGVVFSIDWMKNRPIHWMGGSYGVGFKKKEAKKSFPMTYEEAKSLEMDLLFLQALQKPGAFFPEDILRPDEMTFLCGGRHPSKEYRPNYRTTYKKNVSIQRTLFQIPLSFFIGTMDFYKYLKKNRFVKCRVVLKKQGILRYFSQDLKLIYTDAHFLRHLNSLSEDDTDWRLNTLSRFLYWL